MLGWPCAISQVPSKPSFPVAGFLQSRPLAQQDAGMGDRLKSKLPAFAPSLPHHPGLGCPAASGCIHRRRVLRSQASVLLLASWLKLGSPGPNPRWLTLTSNSQPRPARWQFGWASKRCQCKRKADFFRSGLVPASEKRINIEISYTPVVHRWLTFRSGFVRAPEQA